VRFSRPLVPSAFLALSLVLANVASSKRAAAQTDDERAAARAAATEGIRAFQEGRYKDAVDLCTRAETLMHAPTHLLLIARSQAKLGHLVEAQEAYFRIKRDALPPDAPRAFVDAQQAAGEEQAALAPRVPTLKVDVEGANPKDVALTVDGQSVPAALIGLARPINPGRHTVLAKATAAESEPLSILVAEGSAQSLKLTLHPIPGAAAAGGAETGGDHPSEPSHRSSRWLGWTAIGIGAAGVIAGTVLVFGNRQNRSQADALCNSGGCPVSKRSQIDSLDNTANTEGTLSWVAYGVGAAGIVTGAVLLLVGGGKSAPSPQTAGWHPWIGDRSAGVTLRF
jgi:hypothetical protein